jgi:hypothetical protein
MNPAKRSLWAAGGFIRHCFVLFLLRTAASYTELAPSEGSTIGP